MGEAEALDKTCYTLNMKKITTVVLLLIIASVITYFIYKNNSSKDLVIQKTVVSFKNATFKINGLNVTLNDGKSELPIANSSSKIITQYFGNEVVHDLNNDGRDDIAFIMTQKTGGSGTFFYVVAALNTPDGYVGTEGVLIGDRISPQSTNMGKGNIIVVNYADRKSGESFAIAPSVGKSIWLLLDPKTLQFGEVAQNFEGEAAPEKMTLDMKKWNWINTTYSDGKIITPKVQNRFTLTFKSPNQFSATTDCNGVGGEYTISGNKITFDKMMSTLMFCEGSQESDFSSSLSQVSSYHFTSKGELAFDLKMDSGVMVFK